MRLVCCIVFSRGKSVCVSTTRSSSQASSLLFCDHCMGNVPLIVLERHMGTFMSLSERSSVSRLASTVGASGMDSL